MGKVTLVRPDGTTLNVDQSQAEKFRVLGYREESPEELYTKAVQESTAEYYTRPGQKIRAGLEGVASGVSLGLSDLAFDAMGADVDERAAYNPGVRLGGEIVGSLLPLGPGMLGKAAKAATPAGLLTRGAEAVADIAAVKNYSRAVQVGVQGAVEGAGFGAGAALADAVLNNDPITVESIGAGLGFGALWGGGLGAIAGKSQGVLEARAARKAAAEAQEAATREAFSTFRSGVDDITSHIDDAFKAVSTQVDETKKALKINKNTAKEIISQADTAMEGIEAFSPTQRMDPGELARMRKSAATAYQDLQVAYKAKDYGAMAHAQERFDEAAKAIGFGSAIDIGPMSPLLPMEEMALDQGVAAFKDMKQIAAAGAALKGFPVSPAEFASMTPARAEKIFAGADTFLKTQNAEMAGLREALKTNISQLSEAMGISIQGSPATQLRGLYEAARLQNKAIPVAAGELPWMATAMRRGAEYSGGAIASGVGKSMGMGGIGRTMAYEGGKRMVQALLGIRQGVVGGITKATTDWAPKAAAKAGPLGSRIGALAIRLDGTEDKSTKDAREQMRLRSEEIRGAAGGVRDVLYKNLQGLAELHPELAAALHEHEVAKFEFLLNKLPQDPGLAMNRLKSMWRPSPVEMEKFARYYEVFQNPVTVINTVLKTGKVTPEWAEGLKEMYPALWTELRIGMLNRLGDPTVINKLTYNEQVSLGSLLDIPIHSSLTPQFVAGQQQMFLERKQPLTVPPQPGISSNGGRPPGPANDPRASTSQKVTAH